MYCLKRFVLLLFALGSLAHSVDLAFAEGAASDSKVLTFEALGFREDRRVVGINSELVFDLAIPRGWEPVQPVIDLHFSHSRLLLPDLSHLTVYYNDIPLEDVKLTTKNAVDGWLQITIPESVLVPGKHKLRIAVLQRLHEEPCVDSANAPGLWTIIHKDSRVTLQPEEIKLDLAWYPEPFSAYGRKAVDPVSLTMVLPDNPTEAEYYAAGLAMAKLGQLAGVEAMDFSLRMGSVPTQVDVFVIAETSSLKKLLRGSSTLPLPLRDDHFTSMEIGPVDDDTGVIQLAKRSDGSSLLLLSGVTDLALRRAGAAMADINSLKLMSGQYTLIKETPRSNYDPENHRNQTTLLGLTNTPDQRVEGVTIEMVRYCFRLPPNWIIEPDAFIELNYSHSPLLWSERSSLLVGLNNVPLLSLALDNESSQEKVINVPLPSHEFIAGFNCLQFTFTLRLEQTHCTVERGGEVWGSISADSIIHLPYTLDPDQGWQPNLNQYPYPFNLQADLSDVNIVLPSEPSKAEIAGALQVAARLGSDAKADALQLALIPSTAWSEDEPKQSQLIIIGDRKRNITLDELTADLEMSESDLLLSVREELLLRQQAGSAIAMAELLPSPWGASQGHLSISGNSDQALVHAFEVLSTNQNEEKLAGNIMTVTEDGIVHTIDTYDRLPRPTEIVVQADGLAVQIEKTGLANIQYFVIAGAILFVVVLIIGGLLAWWERRRRRTGLPESDVITPKAPTIPSSGREPLANIDHPAPVDSATQKHNWLRFRRKETASIHPDTTDQTAKELAELKAKLALLETYASKETAELEKPSKKKRKKKKKKKKDYGTYGYG
ncbi:MAG: cellulose biosynthesis cyclic di-GMP-binding regulatory protein BcsB [Chloroflexota bacterium]